jgi:hypothetical protein
VKAEGVSATREVTVGAGCGDFVMIPCFFSPTRRVALLVSTTRSNPVQRSFLSLIPIPFYYL